MNEPSVGPNREWDAQGRLVSAGVTWTEYNMTLYNWCLSVALIALFIAIPSLLFVLLSMLFPRRSGHEPFAFLLFLVFGGVAAGMYYLFLAKRWTRRTLNFKVDGRIHTPEGRAFAKDEKYLPVTPEFIRSIEREKADYLDAVIVYSTEGAQAAVGYRLCPSISLIVTVQLNKALQEIRQARAAPGASAAPVKGRRKID